MAAKAVQPPTSAAEAPAFFEKVLAAPADLPQAAPRVVLVLLLLIQGMYLSFYVSALANLGEIQDLFAETAMPWPTYVLGVVAGTGAAMIPVRMFLLAAVAFKYKGLEAKFRKLFPALFLLDELWAVSPFLLLHHLSVGVALAMSAPLVYLPFAQRSLVLMYARGLAAGCGIHD